MSKKNAIDPQVVQQIIKDYYQALTLAKGESAAAGIELVCKKGLFYMRRVHPATSWGVSYRRKEIEAMTAELRKQIPQRGDSEEDSFE